MSRIKGFGGRQRLPRLGIIRLGELVEKQGSRPYPRALDHFRLDDAPEVAKVYGEAPKELDIMIPTEQESAWFDPALRAYGKGTGLFCSSHDGETASRSRLGLSGGGEYTKVPKGQAFDAQGEDYLKSSGLDKEVTVGERFDMPCPFQSCPYYIKSRCRETVRILVLLPKVPGLGVYQITSTSNNAVNNFESCMDILRNVVGRVSMIPLKLKLVPQEVIVEGKKKTVIVMLPIFPGLIGEPMALRKELPAAAASVALPAPDLKEVPADLYSNGGADLDNDLGQESPAKPASQAPAAPNGAAATAARARLDKSPAQAPATQAPPTPEKPAQAQPPKAQALAKQAQPPLDEDEAPYEPGADPEETLGESEDIPSKPQPRATPAKPALPMQQGFRWSAKK